MNDGLDIVALNVAWIGWEVARWQDAIDWGLSAAGACTLVVINVIRLRKMLRERRDVDNDS